MRTKIFAVIAITIAVALTGGQALSAKIGAFATAALGSGELDVDAGPVDVEKWDFTLEDVGAGVIFSFPLTEEGYAVYDLGLSAHRYVIDFHKNTPEDDYEFFGGMMDNTFLFGSKPTGKFGFRVGPQYRIGAFVGDSFEDEDEEQWFVQGGFAIPLTFYMFPESNLPMSIQVGPRVNFIWGDELQGSEFSGFANFNIQFGAN